MNRYCFLILITLGVFACDTQLTPYMEQLTQWDKALENNPETIGDSLATLNVAIEKRFPVTDFRKIL